MVHALEDSRILERYDNIALLLEGLTAEQYKQLLQYIDRGGNILIAVDELLTTQTRDFLRSCGVAVRPIASVVVDHSAYALTADRYLSLTVPICKPHITNITVCYSPVTSADHSIVLAEGARPIHTSILPQYSRIHPLRPVAYRGIALYTPDASVLSATVWHKDTY